MGRGEELERLRRLLTAGGTVAIAAAGLGGVGKTALAREYGRRYRGDYPAGIWWLEARETPGERLANFLTEVAIGGWGEPSDSVQTDGQRAQWIYQQWLSRFPEGNRLIIWDDGSDFQSIRPLLPTDPRFQVLITTRERWEEADDFQRLDLEILPPLQAYELLYRSLHLRAQDPDWIDPRVLAQPQALETVAEWLGYLPLGLKLVGSFLRLEPDLSLADLYNRLQQERLTNEALTPVQAAFELSWAKLIAPEQQLLGLMALLGLAPVPWDLMESCVEGCRLPRPQRRWWMRWRGDLPEPEQWCFLLEPKQLEQARRQLVQLNLVERVAPETYGLHALVREFGRGKLGTKLEAQGDELRRGVAAAAVKVAKTVPQTVTLGVLQRVGAAVPHLEEVARELTAWIGD
ncbi:MAG: NB-ARC domain-containing protein, partial [Prochlorothrix sp.]